LEISCRIEDVSHSYGGIYLFRNIHAEIRSGCIHLITGWNGSGKSTFLRLLSTATEPEKGQVVYQINQQQIDPGEVWKQIALVAPYQELPEDFTLGELIRMQQQFSSYAGDEVDYHSLARYFGLSNFEHKAIKNFSTGMKQKARFVLAFGSGRPIWLLDEPGSNLDAATAALLREFLREKCRTKLIVLASNDPSEISLGQRMLDLSVSC
jgi:ABC-type multidrug transport system ATPase subunit